MISVLSLYESSFNVSNSVIASSNACYKYTSSLLTTLHTFNVPFSGTTTVSQYQKGKINVDFTEARTVSGSGISLAVCKSAPCPRQITMPAPHHSVFTGRMPFLLPNQQRQSTEGIKHSKFTRHQNSFMAKHSTTLFYHSLVNVKKLTTEYRLHR